MMAAEENAESGGTPAVNATVNPAVTGEPLASNAGKTTGAELDRATQASIGDLLRRYYDDLAHAPMPDHLTRLWDELERKDQERNSANRPK